MSRARKSRACKKCHTAVHKPSPCMCVVPALLRASGGCTGQRRTKISVEGARSHGDGDRTHTRESPRRLPEAHRPLDGRRYSPVRCATTSVLSRLQMYCGRGPRDGGGRAPARKPEQRTAHAAWNSSEQAVNRRHAYRTDGHPGGCRFAVGHTRYCSRYIPPPHASAAPLVPQLAAPAGTVAAAAPPAAHHAPMPMPPSAIWLAPC